MIRRFAQLVRFERGQELWLAAKTRFNPTEQQRLFGLTILIGGVCGLVAVAFHMVIRWLERATIERAFEVSGHGWIPWVIVVPTLGALCAGIALYYIPGARGSGVPQVKVAYASKAMKLRIRDSFAKFAIGAVQIGTGSSLGREGPTVQICSGIAKLMARIGGVAAHNVKLLLPVGVAAGIAAAFNAPIAAVTFTIEEVVGKLDQTLLSGVIVAAALAAVVERSILGENPVMGVPPGYGLDHAESLLLYAAMGVAAALLSVVFTDGLLRVRAWFQTSRLPGWFRPAIGGLFTGGIAVAVMLTVRVGGVTGGGYSSLVDALHGRFAVDVLIVLCVAKLVATVMSYSSGGAGGIFAPSLFLGAMLGGAFGALDIEVFDHSHVEYGSFALVGMGAVFAGVIRAPITSVLIIIEMTNGYSLALPLMIANMSAYGLARRLRPLPIYEALLVQDGIDLHEKKKSVDSLELLTVERIAVTDATFTTFSPDESADRMLQAIDSTTNQLLFPVLDANRVLVGIVTLEDLTFLAAEDHLELLVRAADIMRPPIAVKRVDTLGAALSIMSANGLRVLPIVDDDRRVIALVDEPAIAHEYLRARAASLADPTASGVIHVSPS
ncbi:MAG: chloride channel protein [Kofleriaceae bacterium]